MESTSEPARKITLLLAASPGLWRNSFESYLRALPQLEVLITSNTPVDVMAALHRHGVQTLVVEMTCWGAELPGTVAALARAQTTLNILVIANTQPEYRAARNAGLPFVWLKSILPELLDPFLFAGLASPRSV